MQTLRKKTSPLKYKNETSRFLGEGVSFKAKLIGILEVSEARGDRMCQEALSDLKMAIRAAGEHKQRITINIAIDGLRLRDEKTGDSLYHHPVHKISFIAQDMTDSRAFGYIFGSPDTGHRFFGIKTDKAASQVVIAMRDLFQVVFALKKKEIELAKQHLDKNRHGASFFSESTAAITKTLSQDTTTKSTSEAKSGTLTSEVKSEVPAVADLVDLELELNSLQQGITQMERITPSDPFGSSKDDPFGDSFTPYPPKLILPPPPSGRERSNRASESSSVFSPKTPHTIGSVDADSAPETALFSSEKEFNFSSEFNSSHDEPGGGDWFATSASDKIFEEPPLVPEASKEQLLHELTKQEILSQFDVFTELDPLGMRTGKIKPYIDKKDFFHELKNPPKKVLNDLVGEKQPQKSKLFNANFDQQPTAPLKSNVYGTDPFGEDPFDKTDPFAETDFSKQDPFDTENFKMEFKVLNKDIKLVDLADKLKFSEGLQLTNKPATLDKQTSLLSTSPRTVQFDDKLLSKLSQVHENCSLDMSSESECPPEPPPRPQPSLVQLKPPPLPPKKQPGDLCSKPPPRPPHTDESHYDYIDNYETGPNSLESIRKLDNSPQLPAPVRKTKFESDFISPPQRPQKNFNLQHGWSSEEDYLTPRTFLKKDKDFKSVDQTVGPIVLPPPQRAIKRTQNLTERAIETKSNLIEASDTLNLLDGLDITLSQLTLSGLNEIAIKLDIPANQLSNMTLVQLTEYISNVIKHKKEAALAEVTVAATTTQFEDFKADFANFNNFNEEPHDKYAVFRELLQDEIKQTKIDTEPEEHIEERIKEEEEEEEKLNNLDVKLVNESEDKIDRYAALREIVENEIKQNMIKEEESVEENNVINEDEVTNETNTLNDETTNIKNENNIIGTQQKLLTDKEKEVISPRDQMIEYSTNNIEVEKSFLSPAKVKSPIPNAVTEVIHTNNHLTSGSLSDVVSGSSPEIDNTGSTTEVNKKSTDAAGESWAIFDQPNLSQNPSRDKQSEEGVSPWSSDSKEFGNGSPPDWNQRPDSEGWNRRRREQDGWWDTSAEPEAQYYPSNRRSTDSYEDEYEYYERPARRRRQMNWASHGGGVGGQGTGGHSSSSRDASPWEEEPRRRELRDMREHRETWSSRHTRGQHLFDRQRDRRHTDSWDEEDDYEYDEEYSGRYHWPERHMGRESEKERHGVGMRDRDLERWADDWGDSRRHRRRRETDRERWCCPDWEQDASDISHSRYSTGRWRDCKHEERYYSRDSQESPWEDDYKNEPEEKHSSRFLAAKRSWKRPSSASEMDRKTGETKLTRQGQYYMGTGGSDGERDRRYKAGRRSRSKDSQFTESGSMHSRHKIDPNLTLRGPHRSKGVHQKAAVDSDISHDLSSRKSERSESSKSDLSCSKRSVTISNKKKTKESPKTEEATFSRKIPTFENNFVPSETESPVSATISPRFTFENDFETSEPDSPITSKATKGLRFEKEPKRVKPSLRYDTRKTTFKEDKISPCSRSTQKSPFEDDFSPPVEKPEMRENISTSSIKEEMYRDEEEDSFGVNNFDKSALKKKMLSKGRLSNNFHMDSSLKKSDSVNIFARESDPFDDEFFSGKHLEVRNMDKSSRSSESKWTEDFDY